MLELHVGLGNNERPITEQREVVVSIRSNRSSSTRKGKEGAGVVDGEDATPMDGSNEKPYVLNGYARMLSPLSLSIPLLDNLEGGGRRPNQLDHSSLPSLPLTLFVPLLSLNSID